MKKLFTSALALTLALSCSTAAFATTQITESTAEPKTGDTEVSMNVGEMYTVTIPETVVLNEKQDGNYANTATITGENIRLHKGQTLDITITSDFKLDLYGATGITHAYTLTVGDSTTPVTTDGTVATFNDSNATQESDTLNFSATAPTYAGIYTDTVTFTVTPSEVTIGSDEMWEKP